MIQIIKMMKSFFFASNNNLLIMKSNNNNYQFLLLIHDMYNFDNINKEELDNLNIYINKNYNKLELEKVMKVYGFIFV